MGESECLGEGDGKGEGEAEGECGDDATTIIFKLMRIFTGPNAPNNVKPPNQNAPVRFLIYIYRSK